MNESLGPKAALRQSNVAERHAGRRKARAPRKRREPSGASESSQVDCLPPPLQSDIAFALASPETSQAVTHLIHRTVSQFTVKYTAITHRSISD